VNKPATTTTGFHDSADATTFRRTVFRVLETAQDNDGASRIIDICLIALISLSVVAVILESVASIEVRYGDALALFESVTIAAFSVEYLLRIWSAVEVNPAALQRPVGARLRYALSFHAVIDLLAILPFYLLFFSTFGGVDMRFLRAIRLLRVLKLSRYSAALNMLFMTFRENGKALSAAFLILITVMLLAASGMYYFERQSQPTDFGSIPAAMWWAFATLTTVGYGDVTPITVGGKIFGALITVVGIGMVALPTSILATGYSRQLKQSTSVYRTKADAALDDGVLSETEKRDLESLRIDLGLSKNTASQILDAGWVRHTLKQSVGGRTCPQCQQSLREDRTRNR
jgi:voltage-gated potassium channel